MKKFSLQTLTALFMCLVCASCTDTEEVKNDLKNISDEILEARALVVELDSTISETPVVLKETAEMLALKEIYEEKQRSSISTFSVSSSEYTDENFSSNIYAIRELPVTIKVRSVASGSISGYNYFACSGAGKEVILGSSSTTEASKFYLKVLPATTGIPYLIYSNVSNTPLSVGYYTSNPDEKIIMSCSETPSSYYSCDWDLLPSSSNSGYFAIQSNSYLGQSDPDNMWSVFYYVLEASSGNKIRYDQYVAGKAQQEFLIVPDAKFELQSIEYDLSSATVSTGGYDTKTLTSTNSSSESKPMSFEFTHSALETSYFSQDKSYLTINLNDDNLKLPRPYVAAEVAMLPDENATGDATYKSTTIQNIARSLSYTFPITASARSIYTATAKFKYYNLSMDYVIKARYVTGEDVREVKFTGRWSGKVYEDPSIMAPECSYTRTEMDDDDDIILNRPILIEPLLPIDSLGIVTP